MRRLISFIAIFVASVGFLIAGSPPQAHAYSMTAVSTYLTANSIYLNTSGQLVIDWQKVQLGFGYDLPHGIYGFLSVSINGTSTADTADLANAYTQPGGACGYFPLSGTSYSTASTLPFGNVALFSNVYDANSSAVVSAAGITAGTPIYINLYERNSGGGCSASAVQFDGSALYYINANLEPVSAAWLQPFDGATIGIFPNWSLAMSNNTESSITGVVLIHWGLSPDALVNTVSSTYTQAYGLSDWQLQIPQTIQMLGAQQTSTNLFAEIEITAPSSSFDITYAPISFVVSRSASNTISIPLTNFPQFTGSSSTDACGNTTSSFVDDPVTNLRIGFCQAMTWVFLPSSDQQSSLGSLFSSIGSKVANKPPFGYFTSASNEINGLSADTSSSAPLMNASTTLAMAGVLNPLDTGLALVISLMLLTWIYHRARHFEPV